MSKLFWVIFAHSFSHRRVKLVLPHRDVWGCVQGVGPLRCKEECSPCKVCSLMNSSIPPLVELAFYPTLYVGKIQPDKWEISGAANRHFLRDSCKGFDLARGSWFVVGDVQALFFIMEEGFCVCNCKDVRQTSLNKRLNKNVLTPPHCVWSIAWISTQWGILYSILALNISTTD